MQAFVCSIDCDIWDIIETRLDDKDRTKIRLDWKAKNLLYCALDPTKFNRISTCMTSHEIWNKLIITHEGTDKVKESRLNILNHQYDSFHMNENECINDMVVRFNNIVNELISHGEPRINPQKVKKFLRSLSSRWHTKRTVIEEKDLNNLEFDELIGSLLTYEIGLKEEQKESSTSRKKTCSQVHHRSERRK